MAGGTLGLIAGKQLSPEYKTLAQASIGIGTLAIGLKMFISAENILVAVGSFIIGGLVGHLLGIQAGMDALGQWAQGAIGGGSATFQQAFVTPTILFCVGPVTLLGCLEDGLEGKINLLAIKSILDGISAIFLAAALGAGVLLSAVSVLVVQTPLTLGARRLRFLHEKPLMLSAITSAGGLILLAIGLDLLELKKLPTGDFLPSLVIAAIFARLAKPASINVAEKLP